MLKRFWRKPTRNSRRPKPAKIGCSTNFKKKQRLRLQETLPEYVAAKPKHLTSTILHDRAVLDVVLPLLLALVADVLAVVTAQ